MRGAERGFLLLSSSLGAPQRHPLTTAQLRTLADRFWNLERKDPEQALTAEDLRSIGYGQTMAERILELLSHQEQLDYYLSQGKRAGCFPITRVSEQYPLAVRKRLGLDSPGVLWAKGDIGILGRKKIALVGSRDILPSNKAFAQELGYQAARQGYVLVSGNARGSDRIAQDACLASGGQVITVLADRLSVYPEQENVLALSEEDFDMGFSALRALSRNRIIHTLGQMTFVAQCTEGGGGTWNGTLRNLRGHWSPVFVMGDGTDASRRLVDMGAQSVKTEQLQDLSGLPQPILSFFDQ